MITINLLPVELRPIKRSPLPHLASVVLLLLAVAGMAQVWMAKQGEIRAENAVYAEKEAALNALKDTVDQYNRLSEQKLQLKTKVDVIQEILKDRTIWSEQLHLLTLLMPENIWLSQIRETSKRSTETVMELDPTTKQMKSVRKPVIKPILEVQGYARPREGGGDEVNPYIEAVQSNPRFSKRFRLDRTSLSFADDRDGNRVRSFTLEFEIIPPAEAEQAARPQAPGGASNV